MKKIIVLGAGFGGVLTAKYLGKQLADVNDVSITLIDQNTYHTMRTEIHAAATNRGKAENIIYDLADIYKGTKVQLVQDTITDLDTKAKTLTGAKGTYEYDYLVISAGSKPTYFGIEGAEKFALPFWTYDDSTALKAHLEEVVSKAMDELHIEERKKLLTFVVCGAGLTGVELAGELGEYIPMLCKKYHVDPSYATVIDLDAAPRAIPNFPEKLSTRIDGLLKSLNVETLYNAKVQEVTKDSVIVSVNGQNREIPSSTVIWSAGITANDITQKAAEQLESGKGSRLVLDYALRSVSDESIYVCGDNMYYQPAENKPVVLQMVENCEQASKIVAHNLTVTVTGNGKLKKYKPSMHGCMISIGGKKGLAYAGFDNYNLKIALPSILTQIGKRFINIVYLAPVVGFDKLPHLIAHEFFAQRKV